MSEKSLDDFFAKKAKGKKGKKNKGKFTTTDEIAKNLTSDPSEQPRKTPKKPEKEKKDDVDADGNQAVGLGGVIEAQEEWNEVVEKETDYSDLKIQALQVSNEPRQEMEEGDEDELDENGDPIRSKGQGSSGPWNKLQNPETTAGTEVAQEPSPATKPETPNVVGGKYVPPARRGQSLSSAASSSESLTPYNARLKSRGNKLNSAPQIGSEHEFPTLAASSDILKYSDKRDERTFETVTRGGSNADGSSRAGGPKLSLDNRFSALGHN